MMRRNVVLSGLVFIVLAMFFGATVFREEVGQAAQAILPVREQNVDANGNIKVRDQNVDANGNIKVHEQVTGEPVTFTIHSSGATPSYRVPAGKRLLIEYINGFSASDALTLVTSGSTLLNGRAYRFMSLAEPVGPTYHFSEQVSIHVDAERYIELIGPSGSAIVNGYLFDE